MVREAQSDQVKVPPIADHPGREAVRNPLRYFQWLTLEYGDIVQYRSSVEPAFLINHPDHIRHVLQSNAINYNKDTYLNKYLIESIAGQGLLTSENPLWRQQRQVIQPAFHRRSLAGFEQIIITATENATDRLDVCAKSGEIVDIAREMMHLTLAIVTQCLFSYDIDENADAVGEAMDTMVSIGRPRHRKVRQAIEFLDELVRGIIDERLLESDDERDDLLAMLLAVRYEDGRRMSLDQVRDEVMSLLVAGHETTANTLSWNWYLLAQNPGVRARLEAELDSVLDDNAATMGDFPHLVYTDHVIQESMRLYPSAWSISRRALGEDNIGGYKIPGNSIVAMSPYTMHRHPEFWPEAERFDPDRFSPDCVAQRPRFAYFPFGGGQRMCIGNHFALMESMIILATIARKYQMQLVPDHVVEEHALVTLRPRNGIHVTLQER